MEDPRHKVHVPKQSKTALTETKSSVTKTSIRFYDLENLTRIVEMGVPAGEKTQLVGVPTLITAPDASFRVKKTKGKQVPRDQSGKKLSEALAHQGFDADILELLGQVIDTRVAQQVGLLVDAAQRAEQETQRACPPRVDPAVMLTAAEFGTRLGGGLSDETVRQREKAGQLFSILAEGRYRGRKYPAFQLLPGIAGKPLQTILKVLAELGGALTYQFMTSPNASLSGLSPLQLLIKETGDNETAAALLALPDAQRLEVVLSCAEDFHAELTT